MCPRLSVGLSIAVIALSAASCERGPAVEAQPQATTAQPPARVVLTHPVDPLTEDEIRTAVLDCPSL